MSNRMGIHCAYFLLSLLPQSVFLFARAAENWLHLRSKSCFRTFQRYDECLSICEAATFIRRVCDLSKVRQVSPQTSTRSEFSFNLQDLIRQWDCTKESSGWSTNWPLGREEPEACPEGVSVLQCSIFLRHSLSLFSSRIIWHFSQVKLAVFAASPRTVWSESDVCEGAPVHCLWAPGK